MIRQVKALNPIRAIRRVRQALAALDAIPALQTKVDQIMVAHQKDARFVERLEAFRTRIEPSAISAFTRAAVMRATPGDDPCPYVVVDELVPGDL